MNGYNVFAHSTFRFHGVRLSGEQVVASITEKDAGCFGQSVTYTQSEVQTHGLLEGCLRSREEGLQGENIDRNQVELHDAFNAIREYKVENSMPLDVSDPCI